jgi:benzoate-CoA ligase family protein
MLSTGGRHKAGQNCEPILLTYPEIPERFNLAAYFLDRNLEEGRGDRTALVCPERAYSYSEVAHLANRVGWLLRELGVEPENRVLLALKDSVAFVASWYAVLKIGAVVAEVYTFLQAKDYQYFLNYSRAKVVVVDGATLDKIRSIRSRCRFLRHVLVVDGHEALLPGEVDFHQGIQSLPEELQALDTGKDEIALWKFTTGSTGHPKATVHCHAHPLVSFHAYARGVLQLQQEDRVLAVPKLFFGYARDLVTLFPFGVGAAGIIFPERSTPERIFRLIQEHRPTILVNVPTMMNEMIRYPQVEAAALASLRLNISSGEALPASLYQQWLASFNVPTLDGIGSSEAYHIFVSNRPDAIRPGSVGQTVPGYRTQVVDDRGQAVADNEIGELWFAGGSTALFYWNARQKSKETFVGDWVHTGDMFRRDADGYFWYEGRTDGLIKVGGIWVSLLEIEHCLLEHPAIQDCAVVDFLEQGLRLPKAYIVLAGAGRPDWETGAALQQFVRSRLAPHKFPREIHFVTGLPKTATGKVDRRSLRESPPERQKRKKKK